MLLRSIFDAQNFEDILYKLNQKTFENNFWDNPRRAGAINKQIASINKKFET